MSSQNVAVIGLQWGDEGKGKVVDALASVCRYVVRYCGGANAGHTVRVGSERFALHLIPCGILHGGVCNVIGNGVVFDPGMALEEMQGLIERGVAVGPENLRVSSAAHMVMPWHKAEDALREEGLGAGKIGTTARGIGPCYADKAHRSTAIRVGELRDTDALGEKTRSVGKAKNATFSALYGSEPMDIEAIVEEYRAYAAKLSPLIANTGALLRGAIAKGDRVLFEGGQGALLDVDHGTYPFVTSSCVSACGIPSGAGVPPRAIDDVIGVVKAYSTRVGTGPFPTEEDNEIGQALRDRGNEYGTTTGRPRRCGWFDAVAARYTAELSGVSELALALLDVLTGQGELKICTGYRLDGQAMTDLDPDQMGRVECIYETLEGWTEDIDEVRRFQDLPPAAQTYVERIEQLVGVPVGVIGVGADRRQVIVRNSIIEGLV